MYTSSTSSASPYEIKLTMTSSRRAAVMVRSLDCAKSSTALPQFERAEEACYCKLQMNDESEERYNIDLKKLSAKQAMHQCSRGLQCWTTSEEEKVNDNTVLILFLFVGWRSICSQSG